MTESINISLGRGKKESLIQAAILLGLPARTPRSVINYFCELILEDPEIVRKLIAKEVI